ncbi:unnamed protein product [Allacma fusca]|uniref:Uncharacterized protein n=1 Tax=Allacma fusca TaxID=39272 RepID=A0A8J2KDL7_9HEXA|nr:unnamed protein product [Allacma fusca]
MQSVGSLNDNFPRTVAESASEMMDVDVDTLIIEGSSEQGYCYRIATMEEDSKRVEHENITLWRTLRQLQVENLQLKIDSLKLETQKLRQELVAGRNEVEMLYSRMDTISRRLAELGNQVRQLQVKHY